VPEETTAETRLGRLRLPAITRSPWWELTRRLLLAIAIMGFTVALVWFDRDGYVDNNDPDKQVDLIDAIYYTTVTLSTTGYGDITPDDSGARLVNAFIITPLRIGFLVLLIGTTIEVLATQGPRIPDPVPEVRNSAGMDSRGPCSRTDLQRRRPEARTCPRRERCWYTG
jgi:voltage-gated potassium channel